MGMNYNSMTARQRQALSRRYTRDQPGKPYLTPENGKLPDIATPAGVHIHVHTTEDDDPVQQIDPSRRPAMRGPALATQGDDLLDRVQSLELALAAIIQNNAGLSDFGGTGVDPDQGNGNAAFTTGGESEDPVIRSANRAAKGINDALPSGDITSINNRNKAFYGVQTGASAGGSPSATPAPGARLESTRQSFQPNQAGGINGNRRMSTTGQRLDPGKTSGWGTADRAMQDRAMFWREQRLATNSVIARINRRNAATRVAR
jgi:hypothetical protein